MDGTSLVGVSRNFSRDPTPPSILTRVTIASELISSIHPVCVHIYVLYVYVYVCVLCVCYINFVPELDDKDGWIKVRYAHTHVSCGHVVSLSYQGSTPVSYTMGLM